MEFKDNRSRRMVLVGNCMLNQNVRFPGIAVKPGPFDELIGMLMRNGVGIEQLPCLECLGWGGIDRKTYYRFQPLLLNWLDKKVFPAIYLFYRLWLYSFSRLCNKEAAKVVKRVEDYVDRGYDILGIVASNDSPTCGVTMSMDLLEAARKFKSLGYKTEDLENPDYASMRVIIPSLCTEGSGLFMGPLMSKLQQKHLDIQVIGFNPWAESLPDEAGQVAKRLNLSIGRKATAVNSPV